MANLSTILSLGNNAFSTASSSASTSLSCYQVFINHRGPDVKNTFASHLYRRLLDRGLSAFLDREELEEGHNISSQIEQAIRTASVHIAILSPTYAESSWCLNELVLMKNSRATILPIFFNVHPSVVRHTVKDGEYAEALRNLQKKRTFDPLTGKYEPRYGLDTIQSWRTALSYVADLSGFELKSFNGDEGELSDKVLQRVLNIFSKRPLLSVAKYPTGLELKLEEFEKIVLQEQEEQVKPRVVGIVGVGGVGKTTLAKEFFNLKRSNYNESSFLFEVREKSLNYLRSKLIKDLKLPNIETECSEEAIGILEHNPLSCHALIILDDVTDADQLDLLLPIKNSLSRESLILVTSRDKHVLKSAGVLESSVYNLTGLNISQSKQLFCSYAFHQPFPLPEFADLVNQFARVCDGLPLSLKVVGALVCGHDKSYWTEQLDRLQHRLPMKIEESLRISYDSLIQEDQSIFLDIACFFIREDRDKAIRIWGNSGLQNLQDKCLLDVDNENKINMHHHIKDLGRKIAIEVSMPHRIWDLTTNNTDDLLQQSSPGRTEFHGISTVCSSIDFFRDEHPLSNTMSSRRSRIKNSEIRHLFYNFQSPGMRKLQLVATEEDYLDDILSRVQPPHLLWLRWYSCSHSALPEWMPLKNLRVLEMEGSSLNTLWPHESQALPLELRELNIWAPLLEIPRSIGQLNYLERIAIQNHSKSITVRTLPDEFCLLRSLKYLVFKGFSSLVSLPVAFGELTNLQLIDLEGASSLQMLPNSFEKLTKLKHLSLRGCLSLTISKGTLGDITTLEYLDLSSCRKVLNLLPQIPYQRSLQTLYLQGTKLKEFPSVIRDLSNLEVLKLSSDFLEVLPPWIGDLKSLKILSLSASPQLKSLPDSIGLLTQLTHLKIKDGGIEYFPQSLLNMNNLESLVVSGCPLREFPSKRFEAGEIETLLSSEGERALNKLNSSNDRCIFRLQRLCMFRLKRLELSGTEIREVFFEEGACPNLQRLSLSGCAELRQLEWLFGLPKPPDFDISSRVNVEELPNLETLVSLKWLNVQDCAKLERLQGLGQLTSLTVLNVKQCREIQELPGVEYLTSLERFSVSGCEKLKGIPVLRHLTKLIHLNVRGCREIEELPGVEYLTSLKQLIVGGCEKLKSIPLLVQLTELTHLNVSGCRQIEELPGVEYLTSLELLIVSGCEKIKCIPGLGQFTKLRTLDVGECREIRDLSGVECLISLEWLKVSGCEKLRSIPALEQLTMLINLNVSGCREIEELAGVDCLTSLKWLNVRGCEKLESIPDLGQLTKLRELDVSGCRKLKSISGLGQLTALRELYLSDCYEIRKLPGVEHLISLRILHVLRCPKLRWGAGVLQQLQRQLLAGLKYEKLSKNSVPFLFWLLWGPITITWVVIVLLVGGLLLGFIFKGMVTTFLPTFILCTCLLIWHRLKGQRSDPPPSTARCSIPRNSGHAPSDVSIPLTGINQTVIISVELSD